MDSGRFRTALVRHRGVAAALAFVAALVTLRVAVDRGAVVSPVASQAALFSWPAVAVVASLGAVGLVLAARVGLSIAPGLGWRHRVLLPGAAGVGVGALLAWTDAAVALGVPHVPLPWAVPYYAYGALVSEALYRFFPLPVAAWFGGRAAARWGERASDRGAVRAFWVVAFATALVEPIGFVPFVRPLDPVAAAAVLALVYAFNLASALAFRKAGALAALSVRVGAYAVWHGLYAGLLA